MPEELGKDWVSCISFWNSCQFWNNIPRNNNRKEKKIKIINQTQPTLPKEKKNSQKSFTLESLGTSGRPKIRGRRKNQGGFFIFVSQELPKFGKAPKSVPFHPESKEKRQKKWEFPTAIPTSQPRKGNKKEQNQTMLNRNRGICTSWFVFFSRNRRNFGNIGLPQLEEEQGRKEQPRIRLRKRRMGLEFLSPRPQNSRIPRRSQ